MNQPSSSISPSSPPDLPIVPLNSFKNCQICEKPGHGNHFGAITCRACAAFFRRFGISNNFNFCSKIGKCRPQKPGVFSCKHCRLKKCKMMGMTIDNFQFERDSFFRRDRTNKLQSILPLGVGTFLGRSNLIIFSASKSSKNSKQLIDVQSLLNNSSKILLKDAKTPAIFFNSLEKLAYGFTEIREARRKSEASENDSGEFGMKETFKMWENDLLSVAKCFTYFDEFQQLSYNLKMKLLKGIWVVWNRFEKFESAAIERKKTFGARKWMWEKKNIKIDLSWCSKYSFEELKFFGTTNITRLYSMMQSMLEMELTDVELTYMICQLCLQHVGKRHQGEILEVSERLQDSLSNHLHEYYSRNFGLTRYSARLANMMKFNNFIHQEIYQRRMRLDLMKVFDVFNIEFSDPELFMDYL